MGTRAASAVGAADSTVGAASRPFRARFRVAADSARRRQPSRRLRHL